MRFSIYKIAIVIVVIAGLSVASPLWARWGSKKKASPSEETRKATSLSLNDALSKMGDELSSAVPESGKLRVAVIDFPDLTGRSLPICSYWSEALTGELTGKERLEVVERRMLDKIMKEQNLQMSDLTTSNQLEVGRILEVDWIVTGTITDLGAEIEVNGRVLSVNTGKVVSASKVRVGRLEVSSLLIEVAPKATEKPAPATVPLSPSGRPAVPSGDSLSLTASFVGSIRTPLGNQIVSIQPGTILRSGDFIKVLFTADRACYVYILQYGSTGNASVIFPNKAIALSNLVKGGVEYSIPPGSQWYFLDENTGTESLYLAASLEPITDLDQLIAQLGSRPSEQVALSKSINNVLDDVFTRGPGAAAPPIDMTGTAGYSERNIGGITQGPPRPCLMNDGSQARAQSFVIQGKGIVGRHIVFEHR